MTKFAIFAERPVEVYKKCDAWLIVGVILLWGLGIFTLFVCSANYAQRVFDDPYHFIKRQGVFSVIGIIAFIVCSSVNLNVLRRILPWIVGGAMALCLMAFVPGIMSPRNGAHRWISIPFVGETFQPSELAKVAVILFLANWFDKYSESNLGEYPSLNKPVIALALFVGIVMLQEDFSTALFIFIIGFSLFYMAGAKIGKLLPFIFLACVAMLIFLFTSRFRVNRLIAFINPEFDTHGYNYQTNKARIAIKAGSLFGQGFGSGLEKIKQVPEIQNDYIFSGWAEGMGFIGVLAYFILLLCFSFRAYFIAFKSSSRFNALLVFGAATCILLQSLCNCGVVCGALPATGITLPFFSYGGSSLLITFCLCGFIVNVSREDPSEELTEYNYSYEI